MASGWTQSRLQSQLSQSPAAAQGKRCRNATTKEGMVQMSRFELESFGTLKPYRVVRKCVFLEDERILGQGPLSSSIDGHAPAS